MKGILCNLLLPALVALGSVVQSSAQVARPFPAGRLLPEGQNRPVLLDAESSLAVMVLPENGGEPEASAWEPSGGAWARTYSFGAFPYTCVAVDFPFVALGYEGRISLYERINPTKYVLLSGPPLAPDEIPRKVVLEGTRLAAIVEKPLAAPTGGTFARVYDNSGTAWNLTREIEILGTEGPILDPESVVSDIDLEGERLVVSAADQNLIQIHERNQGGTDAWEVIASIDGSALGVEALGLFLALDGERLAASSESEGARRVEAFSRNLGGADAWGHGGTLLTGETASGAGFLLAADRATGRLGAMAPEILVPDASESSSALHVFGPGGGPGGWTEEYEGDAGPIRVFSRRAPGMAFSGDDLMIGLGGLSSTSAGWEVSVHRRGTGGASSWGIAQALSGPDVPAGFGSTIAAHGNYVAVGMPAESAHGSQSGAVMVWYRFPGAEGMEWLPAGRFESPEAAAGERFGASLALLEDSGIAWLAVGAPGANGGRGAVYLHLIRPTGTLLEPLKIAPVALEGGDAFGTSVSLAGETLLAVGSPGDDDSGPNAGAVYLFEDDLGGALAWGQRAKRLMPAGESGSGFGTALALTQSSFVATRPAAGSPGKVFLYLRNEGGADAWGYKSTLAAPAGAPAGFPSAISGTPEVPLFAIGATAAAGSNGRAYLYGYDAGTESWQQLFATDGSAGEGPSFGSAVAGSFPRMVVGAPGTGSGGTVYTYGRISPPATLSLLHAETGAAGEAAGTAVAATELFTFAGLPGADDAGPDAGAVAATRSGSYEAWAFAQGPAFTEWWPEQDQDGDGAANLFEFAYGTNPLSAGSRPLFAMERTLYEDGATTWPALEWIKPDPPYSTLMLNYQMQRSENLENWADTLRDGGGGLGEPDGHFYRMDRPREFFRLDLRYPEEDSSADGGIIIID